MRHVFLNRPHRTLHIEQDGHTRTYTGVNDLNLCRLLRALNSLHERFALTHLNVAQGTYGYCEIVYAAGGAS